MPDAPPPLTPAAIYSGGLADTRALARRLDRELAADPATDPLPPPVIGALSRRAAEVHRLMRAMGMFARCATCGAGPGGGCCSRRMAHETDAVQLLFNLRAGVDIAPRRDDDECCYLGTRGCVLRFKPFYCLNYLCPWILEEEPAADIAAVRRATGALLQAQVDAEDRVLRELRRRGRLR